MTLHAVVRDNHERAAPVARSPETTMANRDTFTPDEWTTLRLTPSLIAGGIAAADHAGLFASIKEAAAGAKGVAEAYDANASLELFGALKADRSIPGMPDPASLLGEGTREQQMQTFRNNVLARVASATALVAAKASAAETDAYRRMLVGVAEAAANASKEGGFLGFGGVQVSDNEQAFIAEVKKAAGLV